MVEGGIEKIVLDWKGSPVERGVEWLAGQSCRADFTDLSPLWVITQTSGAGRRLREGLAQFAAERGRGCLLPKMSTPGSLIQPEGNSIDGFRVATPVEMQAHWMTTLKKNELAQFPHLFPRIPQVLDVTWGMSMSRALIQMRQILAEANHDCLSVEASQLTEKWAEQDRWADLARLEALYRERLEQNGLIDPLDAGRRWVRTPSVPRGIKEVLLLGVSGFPDLGRTALFKLMELGVSVRIAVFSDPGEENDSFDDMGRPVRGAWESRPLPLTDQNLHLAYGPVEQARFACEKMRVIQGVDEEKLNLAVLDPEVKEVLMEAGDSDPDLADFHDPEGISGDQAPLYFWLKAIQELIVTEGMTEAGNLLRFPLTLHWLDANGIVGEERTWLEDLDEIQAKNIPQKLADGLYFAQRSEKKVSGALRGIEGLIEQLRNGEFEEEIKKLLEATFSAHSFTRENPEDLSYLELLPKIGDWLAELSTLKELSMEERFSLLLRMIAQTSWVEELKGGEIKLNGWLELPWADAPQLLILGCNDSFLPGSLPIDSFIPQSLRRELGLWTDEDRSGRDAYLLHWILASHHGSSGVDFVMGKFNGGGAPLKPSPLFFICEPGDAHTLPDRAEKLFGEVPPEAENPAWSYPWRLKPGKHLPVRSMSVTSFRSFLSCPFRFYLKKKFGMEKYNPHKAEADIMDFGTLTHSALEVLADPGLKDANERSIFSALKEKLESEVNRRYGRNPGLSILQQKASIERRLEKVARDRVVEKREGWEIVKVEEKFILDTCGSEEPGEWKIMNKRDDPLHSDRSVRIVGMIDRIDCNQETGSFRVLDYKTSSKGPEKLHIRGGTVRMEEYPECAKFLEGEKIRRWTDLQLPLYRFWAEKALLARSGQNIGVGIYNLPAKEEEIGISLWTGLDDELMRKAMKCAVGVIGDLLDPAEHQPISKVDYDDFEDLFFHSPNEAIGGFER
jgi:ATP-dependent helicase/nuclease subunit B